MSKQDYSNYKFYHYKGKDGKNTISAVSSYAGRPVKGYAKCDPRDEFDEEKGKALAAARCNLNVAQKRARRARQKYEEAEMILKLAQEHFEDMKDYRDKSEYAEEVARKNIEDFLTIC